MQQSPWEWRAQTVSSLGWLQAQLAGSDRPCWLLLRSRAGRACLGSSTLVHAGCSDFLALSSCEEMPAVGSGRAARVPLHVSSVFQG